MAVEEKRGRSCILVLRDKSVGGGWYVRETDEISRRSLLTGWSVYLCVSSEIKGEIVAPNYCFPEDYAGLAHLTDVAYLKVSLNIYVTLLGVFRDRTF